MQQLVRRSVGATATLVTSAVMAAWPEGGQGTARRNAWGAMVSDHSRARARDEAHSVLAAQVAAPDAVRVSGTGS